MNKKETYNTPDRNDARQRKIKRIYLVTATTAALVPLPWQCPPLPPMTRLPPSMH